MLDPIALLRKHRSKGALVDANLLVLFFVGTVNRHRIISFKRTRQFTPEDYDLLVALLKWFGNVIVTPHILSQASDLTDLSGDELLTVRQLFRVAVEKRLAEIYDESNILVANPVFEHFGLADAAIAAICARGTLVITTDRALAAALSRQGADALHFDLARVHASGVPGMGTS